MRPHITTKVIAFDYNNKAIGKSMQECPYEQIKQALHQNLFRILYITKPRLTKKPNKQKKMSMKYHIVCSRSLPCYNKITIPTLTPNDKGI